MRALLLALVLAAAAAAPAAAQPAPWQPERFTAGWVFTPSVVLGGMWDSNVTVANDPTDTNPEIAEWVGLVSPRGEIDFNGKRAKFSAGYAGRLETYQTLEELTRYDQRGRLEARYQMTPRVLFDTRHQLTLTPTTDALDLSGLPFTRVGSRLVASGGGVTTDITRRMKLRTGYMFQWVQFERDERFARLRGGHQHSPTAELTFAVTRRLEVGSTWTWQHASIDGARELVDTQQIAAVAEYDLAEYTSVRGMAGVAHLHISTTDETRMGPSYGLAVSHRVREAVLDAGFQRSFVPSFGFGGMTASREVHARVNVPFGQGRFSASGSVTYRKNTPVLSTSFPIDLTSYWTTGTFGYAIARWLRMEAFARITHQTSSAQGNVDRTRIGVQFVTLKPVRIQ